jgi:hypothetical protein
MGISDLAAQPLWQRSQPNPMSQRVFGIDWRPQENTKISNTESLGQSPAVSPVSPSIVDMNNFDTEKFINEVQNRPWLWNTSVADYSNREVKKKGWEELVNIFGGTELSVTNKRELGKAFNCSINEYNCFARVWIIVNKIVGKFVSYCKCCSPFSG